MAKGNIKEIINSLEKTSQMVRGEMIIDHINYIKEKEGTGGLERLKEKLTTKKKQGQTKNLVTGVKK